MTTYIFGFAIPSKRKLAGIISGTLILGAFLLAGHGDRELLMAGILK